MGSFLNTSRYLLFFFNCLLFILGMMLMAYGLWALSDKSNANTHQILTLFTKAGNFFFIFIGVITMIIGFLGCFGAFCVLRCLLVMYFICLLSLFLLQAIPSVVFFFRFRTIEERVSKKVLDLIETYDPLDEFNRTSELAWDKFQSQMSCCGWNGSSDWAINPILNKTKWTFYPCGCRNTTASNPLEEVAFCRMNVTAPVSFHDWPVKQKGCYQAIREWMDENRIFLLAALGVLAFVELLGMLFSILLFKKK